MQNIMGKTHYLRIVSTMDCAKDRVTRCYLTQETKQQVQPTEPKNLKNTKKKQLDQNQRTYD